MRKKLETAHLPGLVSDVASVGAANNQNEYDLKSVLALSDEFMDGKPNLKDASVEEMNHENEALQTHSKHSQQGQSLDNGFSQEESIDSGFENPWQKESKKNMKILSWKAESSENNGDHGEAIQDEINEAK